MKSKSIEKKILWGPEECNCHYCGLNKICRSFTSEDSIFKFCRECWKEFLSECNIKVNYWIEEVSHNWNENIKFVFVSKIKFNGAQIQNRYKSN